MPPATSEARSAVGITAPIIPEHGMKGSRLDHPYRHGRVEHPAFGSRPFSAPRLRSRTLCDAVRRCRDQQLVSPTSPDFDMATLERQLSRRFSAKMAKTITHQRKLVGFKEPLDKFLEQARTLGEKLAVCWSSFRRSSPSRALPCRYRARAMQLQSGVAPGAHRREPRPTAEDVIGAKLLGGSATAGRFSPRLWPAASLRGR